MTRKWSCPWYLMQMRDIDDDEKNVHDEKNVEYEKNVDN